MSKRIEVTTQTKQNIIYAFWELYSEKRIEKITVKDITNKAGYNRGTFYEYFADVYDVLDHIENSLIPTLDQLPPVSMPTVEIGMPMEQFFELYKQNHKYYSVLLGENGDPAFASKLKNSIKPMIMQIFEENPNVDIIELDYTLEYTLSAMIGIMSYWFKNGQNLESQKLHELIKRLTEQGIIRQLPL